MTRARPRGSALRFFAALGALAAALPPASYGEDAAAPED